MGCEFIYKGKKYTRETFEDYINSNPQEFSNIITEKQIENINSIVNNTKDNTSKQVKEGVSELFESNPKLANEVYEALGFKSKPDVILPIGTSGSGKSTFVKSLPQENLVVIEPDAMRVEFTGDMNDKSKDKEIYEEAAKRAITAIKQGKQVVFDTTNLTKEKRLPFIEAIKKEIPNANIQYKLMELNPELAKQRIKAQLARGENRAAVSDETIDRHAASYKQMLEDIKDEPISSFEITPQQKQQAQQLYSQYLSQNPNGNVEGFKSWVDDNQSNVQYQKQIDLQPKHKQEIQQHSGILNLMDNLSESDKKIALDNFKKGQDVNDVLDMQAKVTLTPTYAPDFNNVKDNLLKTKDKVEQTYTKWKLSNHYKRGTKEYKDKNTEFLNTIKEFEEELNALDVSELNDLVNYFEVELDALEDAIDNFDTESVAHTTLKERLEFMYIGLTGKDLENNPREHMQWDLESTHPDEIINMRAKVDSLVRKIGEVERQVVFNKIKNLPMLQEFKREQGWDDKAFEDFLNEKMNETRADISKLQGEFLGLSSNDDTIFATALHLEYKTSIEKALSPIRQTAKDITKLNEELMKSNFDVSLFREKNERGVDTGALIDIFSSKYTEEVLPEFYKLVNTFINAKGIGSVEKAKAYEETIEWLQTHTEVIDFSKLKSIRDMYGTHPEFAKYFTHSEYEMDAYEADLRDTLGKEFDALVERSMRKMEDFMDLYNHTYTHNPSSIDVFLAERSPFAFQDNYINNDPTLPIQVRKNVYRYNLSKHIEFIPKATTIDPSGSFNLLPTGYYNDTFKDKIMSNDTAYKMWQNLYKTYNEYVNPIYTEAGQNVKRLSWAKIDKGIMEIMKSKNNLLSKSSQIAAKLSDNFWYSKEAGNMKERKANYFDMTKANVDKFVKLANKSKTFDEVMELAAEEGIPTLSESQIRANALNSKTAEEDIRNYKKAILRDIGTKIFLRDTSSDIIRNTLAIIELAALQKARLDIEETAENMLNQHKKIKSNHRENEDGDVDGNTKDDRVISEAKMREWMAVNVYNTDFGKKDKKLGAKKYTDIEKKLQTILNKLLERAKDGEDVFFEVGSGEDKVSYFRKGAKFYSKNSKGNLLSITEADFMKTLEDYVDAEVEKMGINVTPNSILSGLLGVYTFKFFAWDWVKGKMNRAEGKFTNMIMDNTGAYWTPGNNNVSEEFLNFANTIRCSPKQLSNSLLKNKALQMQTLQLFVDELDILQSRKNEIDKKDTQSSFKASSNPLSSWSGAAIDLPEFKNQVTILLNILQDFEVTNSVTGEKKPFFDPNTKQFTIYKPGTLEVLPEYIQYEKSLSNFIFDESDLNGNPQTIIKQKAEHAISEIQGNYSNTDSASYRHRKGSGGITWGRLFGSYLRWMPAHAQQRWGQRDANYIFSSNKHKERFMSGDKKRDKKTMVGRQLLAVESPILGSAYFSFSAYTKFGPTILQALGGIPVGSIPILLGGVKMLYGTVTGKKSIKQSFNELKHLIGFTYEVLMKTVGFPVKLLKLTKLQRTSVNKNITEFGANTFLKGMSAAEVGAVKALAQEVANRSHMLVVQVLLKALIKSMEENEDDDENDEEMEDILKKVYFLVNSIDRIEKNFSDWANPFSQFSENSTVPFVRIFASLYTTFDKDPKKKKGTKDNEESDSYWDADNIGKGLKALPFPSPNWALEWALRDNSTVEDSKIYKRNWVDKRLKKGKAPASEEGKYNNARRDYSQAYKKYVKDELKKEFEGQDISKEEFQTILESRQKEIVDKFMAHPQFKRAKGESYASANKRFSEALKERDFSPKGIDKTIEKLSKSTQEHGVKGGVDVKPYLEKMSYTDKVMVGLGLLPVPKYSTEVEEEPSE